MLSAKLLIAYRRTRYSADTVEVSIGCRSLAMDAVLASHRARVAVFVTAWNPMSRRKPLAWNQRMQRRLDSSLRRYRVMPAAGSWRSWREEHVLVFADHRPVLQLARRFRQAAVVVVRRGQSAALMTSLPVFSLRNSIPNARGALSSPSTTCNFCCRRPPRICADSQTRASR